MSYFCLICGKRICGTINCLVDIKDKGIKEYSLIYHSKKCNGGNGIFLSIKNSEIVYILKRRIIDSGIYIYLNNYGEFLNNKCLNEDYKLNKVELEKGILKYMEMTFRKNLRKIYYRRNYFNSFIFN